MRDSSNQFVEKFKDVTYDFKNSKHQNTEKCMCFKFELMFEEGEKSTDMFKEKIGVEQTNPDYCFDTSSEDIQSRPIFSS